MANFIFQIGDDGLLNHDFSWTLLQQIKNINEFRRKDIHKYSFIDLHTCEHLNLLSDVCEPKELVPIGSIDFVIKFLKDIHGINYTPINIPDDLNHYRFLKRDVFKGVKDKINKKSFIKSATKLKSTTGLYDPLNPMFDLPDDEYIISEIVDFVSEWRVFIFNGKIVGLQNYCGDFMCFPDVNMLKYMVESWTNKPVSCTIDVGIINKDFRNETVLVECHDFFSCGLYGFDSSSLPAMYSQWFFQYIKK